MIKTKQPKVFLYNFTQLPMATIGLAVSAWTSDNFVEKVNDLSLEDSSLNTAKALKAFHKTALEYVDFVFIIKNCSRAFQQQLTRTRLASYSIQSMRIVTKKGFATNGHYTMPPSLNKQQQVEFHDTMLDIQDRYEHMIESGVSAEDARGILPLNIHSDITMKINLASLYNMLSQRFCVNTQWEYRQVATQIKELINYSVGSIFSEQMDAPCVKVNKCPMGKEYCMIPVWKYPWLERVIIYKEYVGIDGDRKINWKNKPEFVK